MRKLVILACAVGALVIAMAGASDAAERRPLPPLAVTDLSGAPVESSGLPDSGTWLLVYVRPGCPGCEKLLEQMDSDERPEPRRIAIIVGAQPEAAAEIRARYRNLADARWLLDSDRSAAKALALPSAPFAAGVRDRTIEWTLAGALGGGAELESVLFSWLGRK
jgi:hypothetical protein